MQDLLSSWIERDRARLEEMGFSVKMREPCIGGSVGVDLDSRYAVGTVAAWPSSERDAKFEFQFNSCSSGELVLLEERNFADLNSLRSFFYALYREKLLPLSRVV